MIKTLYNEYVLTEVNRKKLVNILCLPIKAILTKEQQTAFAKSVLKIAPCCNFSTTS